MHTATDVTQLIGDTPLLHLKQVSEQTGCTILGKAELIVRPWASFAPRRNPANCSPAVASSRAPREIPVLD